MSKMDLMFNGPEHGQLAIVLAHGAGAAMDSPFMEFFAVGLGDRGIRVIRFEFPYMAKRRETGRQRPPDREPVLRRAWDEVRGAMDSPRLVLGGKSMGGRIASLIVDEVEAAGLVCLGYPFHPVGKPDRLRIEHLRDIRTPTLVLQGTRDTFGKQEEVTGYDLSPQLQFHWLADGDHSFKPRKASGRTQEQNWQEGIEAIARFVWQLT